MYGKTVPGSRACNCKSWSPNDKWILGTSGMNAGRFCNQRRTAKHVISIVITHHSALPCKHWKSSVRRLYSILSAIDSECWSLSKNATLSYFWAPVISRTDEFRTDCSHRMLHIASYREWTRLVTSISSAAGGNVLRIEQIWRIPLKHDEATWDISLTSRRLRRHQDCW